jgi:carboxynorspermidine decarboxylase
MWSLKISKYKVKYLQDIVQTPCYVCEEELLTNNLKLLKNIQDESGAKILLALKGFAFSPLLSLVPKYLSGCCASGLYEAKYAKDMVAGEVHTFSPAFKDDEFEEICDISNHIVFNSFTQLQHFKDKIKQHNSIGLRVNPEVSTVEVDIYNPCGIFSRLGITQKEFERNIKTDSSYLSIIEGLHFHALCEQNVDALELVLKSFEDKFGKYLKTLKWVNFGGGHHITRDDYDVKKLIELIKNFRQKHPTLDIYLEPGEAIGWQTGTLVATVLDIVHNGIDIAILDTSAETHMPDTLAMPYKADVLGASCDIDEKPYRYRLAGNTCLAGDIMGDYSFDTPLQVGDKVIFEDMIHYTIVKNTTFNGIKLPSLAVLKKDGSLELSKEFGYDEYKNRN